MRHFKISLPFLFLPTLCFGAAFQHFQQSSASIGYNHADMAVLADEPSVAYYNPAGMTKYGRSGIQFGFATTQLHSSFRGSKKITDTSDPNIFQSIYTLMGGEVVYNTTPYTFFQPNSSVSATTAHTHPTIGFFHAVYSGSYNKEIDFALGLSVINPWGLETDWGFTRIWSYSAKSSFHSLAVNPSASLRFRNIYVGGGLSWQDFRFDQNNTVIGSSADFKLKDSRLSWNVSLLFELTSRTRFGFIYRPSIDFHLRGPIRFGNSIADATCKMRLPQSFIFGGYQRLSPCLELMTTFVLTAWNQFKEIAITTNMPSFSTTNPLEIGFNNAAYFQFFPSLFQFPIKLQNTLFVAVGAKYNLQQWELRGGVGYDSNPIKKYSESILPDKEHYSASLGVGYHFNCHLSLDLGYQFIFIPKGELKCPILSVHTDSIVVTSSSLTEEVSNINEKALYQGSVASWGQVLSAQLKWEF